MTSTTPRTAAFLLACVLIGGVGAARAETETQRPTASTLEADVDELERKLDIVTEELRKLKEEEAAPEAKALESKYGLGAAASKVYLRDRGLSLGGYGEFNYKESLSDGDDTYDLLRIVLYAGGKFTGLIVLNS